VSKSSFLLLSVAFLAAVAGFKSSGARWEEVNSALRYEARADITAFRDDGRAIRNQAGRAPYAFGALWDDVCRDFRIIAADAAADARLTARRISILVKTS
jgi:hypothetical protein